MMQETIDKLEIKKLGWQETATNAKERNSELNKQLI